MVVSGGCVMCINTPQEEPYNQWGHPSLFVGFGHPRIYLKVSVIYTQSRENGRGNEIPPAAVVLCRIHRSSGAML